jgi:hypothetical protein
MRRLSPYRDRVLIIPRRSVDAARVLADRQFDFAYIDGEHSYEAVKEDITAWRGMCKSWIGGHDYYSRFPGVMRAVNEVFGERARLSGINWYVDL